MRLVSKHAPYILFLHKYTHLDQIYPNCSPTRKVRMKWLPFVRIFRYNCAIYPRIRLMHTFVPVNCSSKSFHFAYASHPQSQTCPTWLSALHAIHRQFAPHSSYGRCMSEILSCACAYSTIDRMPSPNFLK